MNTQANANTYDASLNTAGLPGVDYDIDRAWQQRLGQAIVRFLISSLEKSGEHPVQW